MNQLKFHTLLLAILFASFGLPYPCAASGVSGASVTVYNSGRALVSEYRSVTLPKGPAEVVFKNIPDTLDPTSVAASARGMTVHGLEYRYVPITGHNLLDRYVGKELSVILPDPANADARILRKATLLSNVDKPVFQVGSEVYLGDALAYLLPALPDDVQQEPTLALRTENDAEGKRSIRLSYLMGGLNWSADYTLTLDPSGKAGALDGWATLSNSSNFTLTSAALKLVAGDMRRASAPVVMRKAVMLEASMAADNMPQQESFSQFHLYTVPGRVDLLPGATRQLSLLAAPKAVVARELACRFENAVRQLSRPEEQNVELSLRLANTRDGGLGTPLPAGRVRVFQPSSDGSLLLLGEASVDHTGVGGEVVLPMGRSFDVSVKRTQTEFTKLGKQSYRLGWTLAVTNGRPDPQPISLTDGYRGEWQVVNADHVHTRPEAGSLRFDVVAPPTRDGKPMLIHYTVQVTY